jgi:DNA-binding transcriptional regulator PaaX
MVRKGSTQEKILLLLLGGLALSLTRSPRGQFKILKEMRDDWKEINERNLRRAIKNLYESKLIKLVNNKDETTTFILSETGHEIALTFNIEQMTIPRQKWDGKWRVVMSDIPERIKPVREDMRYHLKRLGFIELQHSVFILPYKCRDEVEYLIEFYNIRRFVRYIEVSFLDNELDLRHKFRLL